MSRYIDSWAEVALACALLMQIGVVYFHGYRLGRVLGLRPGLSPFAFYAAGFIMMLAPRILTLLHLEGVGITDYRVLQNVNSVVYVFDSFVFLKAGMGLCDILAALLIHPGARLHAVEAAQATTGKTVESAAATLGKVTGDPELKDLKKDAPNGGSHGR